MTPALDLVCARLRHWRREMERSSDALSDTGLNEAADGSASVAEALEIAATMIEHLAGQRDALLREIGEILKEATTANDVIRLGRSNAGQGRIRVATALHRIQKRAENPLARGDQA